MDKFPQPRWQSGPKKRDRQLKKFKKTGDLHYLTYAQKLSKQIRKIIKREQRNKIQTKLVTPNAKTFWHTIKSMMGMKFVQENLKDEILEDNLRIANAFAKFFVKKDFSYSYIFSLQRVTSINNIFLRE